MVTQILFMLIKSFVFITITLSDVKKSLHVLTWIMKMTTRSYKLFLGLHKGIPCTNDHILMPHTYKIY